MKQFTVEQLTEILDNHEKWLAKKEEGARANLHFADLHFADLSSADLSFANLSSVGHSFTILLQINGMIWPVLLKDNEVTIGCKKHKYIEWKNFSDNEVIKMESRALDFYNVIIPVLDYHYKGTPWEIKQ